MFATGLYDGKETIFVTQVYANPLPEVFKQIAPSKPVVTKNPVSIVKEEPLNILGAETVTNTENTKTNPTQKPAFWQTLYASPRNTINIILYIVFGVIFIALLLYIFIKIRNHHKDLITNGLLLLVIIGAIFVANYYLSYNNMVITQSLDYSNESK